MYTDHDIICALKPGTVTPVSQLTPRAQEFINHRLVLAVYSGPAIGLALTRAGQEFRDNGD